MLLATHVNVTALTQNKQGQTGKNSKTYNNFPHKHP
jgi:hypothetical protein